MKKTISVLMAGSMLVSSVVSVNPIAYADESYIRLSGLDRYETCAKICQDKFNKSDLAILASGEIYPDALSSGALSIKENAPLLLVKNNEIPSSIQKELDRLGVKKLIIVGGEKTVSKELSEKLQEKYSVERISGEDRYETSLKVAKKTNFSKNIIVSGKNYADALVATSLVAKLKMNIILTDGHSLKEGLNNNENIILGGKSSIDIPNLLGQRIAGEDRYQTSLKVAEKYFANSRYHILTSGKTYADALSSVNILDKVTQPIILINRADNAVEKYAQKHLKGKITVVGGTSLISDKTIKEILKEEKSEGGYVPLTGKHGSSKHKKPVVKEKEVIGLEIVEETPNIEELKVKINYNDKTSEIVEYKNFKKYGIEVKTIKEGNGFKVTVTKGKNSVSYSYTVKEETVGSIEYTIGEETKTIAVNDTTSFTENTNIENAEISKIVVKDTEGNPLQATFSKVEDNWVITIEGQEKTYTIHLNYVAPKKVVSSLEVVGSPNKEVVFGETLDLSSLQVKINYENADPVTIGYSEFTEYGLSTNIATGSVVSEKNFEVTITDGEHSVSYNYTATPRVVEKTIGSIEYTIGEETKTIAVNDATSFTEDTNIENAEISKIVVKDTEGNTLPSSFSKVEDNWVITMNIKLSEEEVAKYPSDTYTIHLNYVAPKKYADGTFKGSGDGYYVRKGYPEKTIDVALTLKDDKITKINIIKYSDSNNKYKKRAMSFIKPAIQKIFANNGTKDIYKQVDVNTKATYSGKAFIQAVDDALNNARIKQETGKEQNIKKYVVDRGVYKYLVAGEPINIELFALKELLWDGNTKILPYSEFNDKIDIKYLVDGKWHLNQDGLNLSNGKKVKIKFYDKNLNKAAYYDLRVKNPKVDSNLHDGVFSGKDYGEHGSEDNLDIKVSLKVEGHKIKDITLDSIGGSEADRKNGEIFLEMVKQYIIINADTGSLDKYLRKGYIEFGNFNDNLGIVYAIDQALENSEKNISSKETILKPVKTIEITLAGGVKKTITLKPNKTRYFVDVDTTEVENVVAKDTEVIDGTSYTKNENEITLKMPLPVETEESITKYENPNYTIVLVTPSDNSFESGKFKGDGEGYYVRKKHNENRRLAVELDIDRGYIKDIKIIKYQDSEGKYKARAMNFIKPAKDYIIKHNSTEGVFDAVDVETKATYSGEGYIQAVNDALNNYNYYKNNDGQRQPVQYYRFIKTPVDYVIEGDTLDLSEFVIQPVYWENNEAGEEIPFADFEEKGIRTTPENGSVIGNEKYLDLIISDKNGKELKFEYDIEEPYKSSHIADGRYIGVGNGFNSAEKGRKIEVAVDIEDQTLKNIEILKFGDDEAFKANAETFLGNVKNYLKIEGRANNLFKEIYSGLYGYDEKDPDIFTGATYSSIGILEAFENAMYNSRYKKSQGELPAIEELEFEQKPESNAIKLGSRLDLQGFSIRIKFRDKTKEDLVVPFEELKNTQYPITVDVPDGTTVEKGNRDIYIDSEGYLQIRFNQEETGQSLSYIYKVEQ